MPQQPPPPVRIVLQARSSSTRLPNKVLLPVGGLPLAVLCARRAMNSGLPLVLATSDDPSDDTLAGLAEAYGLTVVRGPLNNVLARFLLALEDLPDDAVCIRLTGDNCLPDGAFIDSVIEGMRAKGLDYFETDRPGLPYGLAAEAVRVGLLRQTAAASTDPADREHVTSWAIRQTGYQSPPVGLLRCTIDTPADFRRMERLFAGSADAVQESWQSLVTRLQSFPDAPRRSLPFTGQVQPVLGTVQLGLAYGIANSTGEPSLDQSLDILGHALANGVACLDTARAYGRSEDKIGAFLRDQPGRFRIVTKLDAFAGLDHDLTAPMAEKLVDASLYHSCHALGVQTLETVLLHRAAHLSTPLWQALKERKSDGLVQRLGVSVQSPEELRTALEDEATSHVQMPFNMLDWRWAEARGWLRQRPEVTVHCRSTLLQGLLSGQVAAWPAIAGVDGKPLNQLLRSQAEAFGRQSPADLAFAYVRAQDWIDGLVFGVETRAQLEENLALFESPPLSRQDADTLEASLPALPEQLLNPALWPRG